MTQNNEKATVKQGTKIPIQTTINNTISVQYIDAVLKLEVTPQITAEGTVFMDVVVENTQIDNGIPRVQGIPALDTQSAETQGHRCRRRHGRRWRHHRHLIAAVDITQVPIVGSSPIIGNLFKRTNVSIQSQELLFFLTPRIIPRHNSTVPGCQKLSTSGANRGDYGLLDFFMNASFHSKHGAAALVEALEKQISDALMITQPGRLVLPDWLYGRIRRAAW